jgi:diadenosine tetraphosphate (Ap4A) HIT family hydrolase
LLNGFPVSPGHTLVIPRRHVASFFDITDAERVDLMTLLAAVRDDLDREVRPAAYNIGINDGTAAGQTVPHLHVHLIPRYAGDRDDPRGGEVYLGRWAQFVSVPGTGSEYAMSLRRKTASRSRTYAKPWLPWLSQNG